MQVDQSKGQKQVVEYIKLALEGLGLGDQFYSPQALEESAARIAKVWIEMTEGIRQSVPELKWFRTGFNGFLIKGPVESYFLCPHHLLPVSMSVLVGIVPKGYTLGISKITRTVLWACKRLAIQEDILKLIADTLWNVQEIYKPIGLVVGGVADHFCEKIRGVRHKSPTAVIEIRGLVKKEFLLLFDKRLKKGR
ncbi:MAG: GTP cyclohydrolase I [candidate division WOR-3 bacterium]